MQFQLSFPRELSSPDLIWVLLKTCATLFSFIFDEKVRLLLFSKDQSCSNQLLSRIYSSKLSHQRLPFFKVVQRISLVVRRLSHYFGYLWCSSLKPIVIYPVSQAANQNLHKFQDQWVPFLKVLDNMIRNYSRHVSWGPSWFPLNIFHWKSIWVWVEFELMAIYPHHRVHDVWWATNTDQNATFFIIWDILCFLKQ